MLLELKDVCKTHPLQDGGRTRQQTLRDVSLGVEQRECVGLVGSSGSGKTTLANIVLGLDVADSGSMEFCAQTQDLLKPRHKRPRAQQDTLLSMQMVFQFPARSFLPRMRVGKGISEGVAYRGARAERLGKEAITDLLAQVDLPAEYADKRISQLSGGECQRVALARALASDPKLLVCDEATSALDVTVQADIVALIDRLCRDRGMACLFITHDLKLAREICPRVYVMDAGEVVESGASAQVLGSPQSAAARRLLAADLAL